MLGVSPGGGGLVLPGGGIAGAGGGVVGDASTTFTAIF